MDAAATVEAAQPAASEAAPADAAGMPSVAVLPFVNIGGDPAQEYFAAGLTEEAITDLAQLSGPLTVVHRGVQHGHERSSTPEAARSLSTPSGREGSIPKHRAPARVPAHTVAGQ